MKIFFYSVDLIGSQFWFCIY